MKLFAPTLRFYQASLMATLTYRWSLIQLVLGEMIGTVGLVLFWYQAAKHSPSGIYTTDEIIIYFLFATLHIIQGDSGINKNLSLDIRSGKLAASLIRPFPPLLSYVAQGLAVMSFRTIVLSPLLFAACFIVFGHFVTFTSLFEYFLAIILMILISCEMGTILGLLAFKMTQTWASEIIYLSFYFVFSGTSYPVDSLAPVFQQVIKVLPFYYLCGFPASLLLGHKSIEVFFLELSIGSTWCVVLFFLLQWMWRKGQGTFESVGI